MSQEGGPGLGKYSLIDINFSYANSNFSLLVNQTSYEGLIYELLNSDGDSS